MLNNLSLDREYVPEALKLVTEPDEPVKLVCTLPPEH